MPSAEPCVFEFGQFGITDWKSPDNGLVSDGALQIVGPCKIDISKGKNVIEIGADRGAGIEWRFAPAQHIGALTPQLLYRGRNRALSNSFLSVLPRDLTGMIADADIVARMFTPDARHPKMGHVYQGWVVARLTDRGPPSFYLAAIYRNRENSSDIVSIWRVVGNSRVEFAATRLGNRIDWSKPWHCRFNIMGRTLKAKWWSCDAIEPDNWDLQATDDADDALVRPGMIGFASTVHGEIIDNIWGLDWYAWSSDASTPAPIYPVEIAG